MFYLINVMLPKCKYFLRDNMIFFLKRFNLTVREQSGQTRGIVKRCSGLHGNMQRIAEMTIPPINMIGHEATDSDNPTEITRADVDAVVATLQGNDAEFISEMKEGEMKIGTGPVRDSYFAMCDTAMIGQLEIAAGFIAKAQYPNQANVSPSEWGSIGNVRFFLSSRGSITVGGSMLGADIYNIFVAAQESYAMINQTGASAKFIYHGPGHGRKYVAVYKSSLIELKLSSRNGEDNNAQAEQNALAA